MNLKQRLCILTMTFALSLITVGNAWSFINSYHEDIKTKSTIIENVSTNYSSFNDKSLTLKESVEEFNNSLNKYYDSMVSTNPATYAQLEEITNTISVLVPIATDLDNACTNASGIDSVTNQKCEIFRQNYSTITNTYVKIIDSYNKVIEEYNNWAKDKGQELLTVYTSTYYSNFK